MSAYLASCGLGADRPRADQPFALRQLDAADFFHRQDVFRDFPVAGIVDQDDLDQQVGWGPASQGRQTLKGSVLRARGSAGRNATQPAGGQAKGELAD